MPDGIDQDDRRRRSQRRARVCASSFVLLCAMAPIGTLVHELGHIAAAEALGYETRLSYGSMTWLEPEGPAPARHEWLIVLGGPLIGVLLGSAGLLVLAALRARRRRDDPLGARGWAALLCALFWSRQVFNLALHLLELARSGEWPKTSDEIQLALHWGLPLQSVDIALGLIGLAVCAFATFRLLPRWMVVPFLAGGIPGALAGYAAWFFWVGPLLLP